MSDGLKQRIVGALVLGALGLIILPVLFDFANPEKVDRKSKLPPAPEIQPVDIEKAGKPASLEKELAVDTIFNVGQSKPVHNSSSEISSGLNDANLPNAWVLQLGSFIEEKKAEEMQDKLRESGFKAFVKGADVKGKFYYRVYVGPKINKNRAMAAKAEIDKQFSTDAIVLQYIP